MVPVGAGAALNDENSPRKFTPPAPVLCGMTGAAAAIVDTPNMSTVSIPPNMSVRFAAATGTGSAGPVPSLCCRMILLVRSSTSS